MVSSAYSLLELMDEALFPHLLLELFLSFYFIFLEEFDNDFSYVNNRAGNNNKLDNIATNNVIETNKPNATVPPKSDAINIKNPKNNTIDVYSILTPVSFKAE